MEAFFSSLLRLPLTAGRWVLLIRDRRRQIRAAADLVAHELEFNAGVADAIALGGRTPATVAHGFAFQEWDKFSATLQIIKAGHPEVWSEVVAAYQELRRTVAYGGMPPNGADLRSLAERLRKAG